jgi:HD-like signal output (HDOD) protein/prolyl-tRNA editing enzyme YbaK/EbsC (Cys-tRNA(Pro) deacylase)
MHTVPTAGIPRQQIAVIILLGDKFGRQQVMITADSLLDLNRLNDLQGRSLRALAADEVAQITRKMGVDSPAALPLLQELPLVVDEALLQQERICIELPDSDSCVTLSQQEFRKVIKQAKVQRVTVPLAQLAGTLDGTEDAQAINAAVQQFTGKRIKQRLEQTLEMPPLPDTAEKIISLRLDPKAGINELAKVVERDPSLAAQVVSWASSPYYAAPNGVTSVRDAIVRVLGFDLVVNLSLGLALGRALQVPSEGSLTVRDYSRESVYMAAIMDGLCKAIDLDKRPSAGLCYLAGLLHNYGYLVLAHVFPPYFQVISRYLEVNAHISHDYIERHVLTITREQISSQLMECWQMPAEVLAGLRWQTTPDYEGQHASYAALMFIGTQLLRQRGLVHGTPEPIPGTLWERIGLAEEKAVAALEKVVTNKDDLNAIAGNMSSA